MSDLARPVRGHFDFGTRYHGDLWLDLDAMFLRPGRLRPAAWDLAGHLSRFGPAAVCGPLMGGAFLAQMVAEELDAAFLPAAPESGSYRVPPSVRGQIGGWPVAIVDDAINAGTAAGASYRNLREAGATPVAVAALLALGPAEGFVTGRLGLPFHALTRLPSQTWPAADCPLCDTGTPLTSPG